MNYDDLMREVRGGTQSMRARRQRRRIREEIGSYLAGKVAEKIARTLAAEFINGFVKVSRERWVSDDSRGMTMIQLSALVAVAGILVSGCITVPPRRLCARGHQERRSKTLWLNENGRMVEGTWEWNEWVCDEWAIPRSGK